MIKKKTKKGSHQRVAPFTILPEEEYRAHPALAWSDLKRIHPTPAEFHMPKGETTPSMVVGTIYHGRILEGRRDYYVRPETYEHPKEGVKPWNGNAAICKQWIEEHGDKVIMSPAEEQELEDSYRACVADPLAGPLLAAPGLAEGCLFAEYRGHKMKCRVDRYVWSSGTLVDLKTTQDGELRAFASSVANFLYHAQLAWYRKACQLAGLPVHKVVIIVLQKGKNPMAGAYELGERTLELGLSIVDRYLDTLERCTRTGRWPGFSGLGPDFPILEVPEWAFPPENKYTRKEQK